VAGAIDQPVGDAVILPMFFLNRAARRSVKTVLTGEGADELLMGYAHQAQLLQLARMSGLLGLPGMAATLKFATRVLPVRFWDLFFSYGNSIGTAGVERLLLLMRDIGSAARRYLNYTSLFEETERVRLYGAPLAPHARRAAPAGFDVARLDQRSPRRGLMQIELDTWLPDNILTKQDNLGMAHGLEGRVPYLDHRLVEEVIGWDEPTHRAAAQGKSVLRRALARHWPGLPRRKKRAFRLDFHPAFRATLLRLTDQHVLSSDSVLGGLVRTARVRELAAELDHSPFLRGKQLAALVVLEAWLRQNVKSSASIVVPPDAVPLPVSH
jgi:asparagine synthase (glutamine-hydrolysing)